MPVFNDITGKRFGRLTAIKCTRRGTRAAGVTMWLCVCDCGREKITQAAHLVNGASKSCGCLQREIAKKVNTTHGKRKTRLYEIFENMISRCYNPRCPAFADYGGRGITICNEWLNDRELFFKWSEENGYTDTLSIDRINNDKGYSPDNCKWANRQQQNHNRRSNVLLTINGVTKVLCEWAREVGISHKTISYRLKKGWSHANAVLTPAGEAANEG